MNTIIIAAGLVAVFAFPLVTYGVMWFTSRDSTDRPEPPETNNPRRTIPGQSSGN